MFTDYLDNPIAVGDVVVYPQSAGSSSARIQAGRVLALDEICKDKATGEVYYYSKRHNRSSYSGLRYPTLTVPHPAYDDSRPWHHTTNPKWMQVDDPSKAYAAKIQKIEPDKQVGGWKNDGKPVTIKNVDRMTVVTSLADFS